MLRGCSQGWIVGLGCDDSFLKLSSSILDGIEVLSLEFGKVQIIKFAKSHMTVGKFNRVPNVYKIKHKEKQCCLFQFSAGWLIYQLTCVCTCPEFSLVCILLCIILEYMHSLVSWYINADGLSISLIVHVLVLNILT